MFFDYLYEHRYTVVWALGCFLCFAAVFVLYRIDIRAVVYPGMLSGAVSLLFLIPGYLRYKRKREILKMLAWEEEDVTEQLPDVQSPLEREYQALAGRMEKNRRASEENQVEAQKDMQDYYATWVHQIKAPIAVLRVLTQREDTKENQEMRSELFRIEQYVDMALCYARLGKDASDLVLQEYELDTIIRKAIRKYAGQFIRKKIRLVYSGTDERALTDEKWLSFILEQLLSNAVKYTAKGEVRITVDDRKHLTVEDTGIGIAPEDVPRIFEKGYTGYNGRMDKKSTGIGLYLVKKASEKLGHSLSVSSVPGKGSRFTIDLNSYPFQAE
ncbi:sensor histidine kinase [Mediterraneibacter sp. NSJ-55]|uniref:histidine kinase n=1 Tax=Mediterraneibacter hominis TaxID=2763054 RepID=A0A923LEP2_9FIRM|nr:sensor histidine kinase [Mediterraneibacter hominis]MBC5687322.1 sensor histidine kinase [Mediterraneibacter hominis]